jgi:hypothetical protein
MDEHYAQILSLCFEEKAKIIIGQRKKSKQKLAGKHLHFEKGDRLLFCKKQNILAESGLAIGKRYFPTSRPHGIL